MEPGSFEVPIPTAELGRQLYRYADLLVSSAWPLTELPLVESSPSASPDITIGRRAAPPTEPASSDWTHHWGGESGAMSLSRCREGNGFLLRFRGLADFVISEEARTIGVWVAPETCTETLGHLLLNQVLPRVLGQQGRMVVHAGAVRIGQEAIAFIGGSGSGKSTLTASFHAAGSSLLSDDGLVLMQGEGTTLAFPTYAGLRLWPETMAGLYARPPRLAPIARHSRKRRVMMTDVVVSPPLPLAGVYVLAAGAEDGAGSISLTRLSPSAACMAIVCNSFLLDVTDQRRAMDLLPVASGIAQQLPVFSLAFPRSFAFLPAVRDAILRQHCLGVTSDSDSLGLV